MVGEEEIASKYPELELFAKRISLYNGETVDEKVKFFYNLAIANLVETSLCYSYSKNI